MNQRISFTVLHHPFLYWDQPETQAAMLEVIDIKRRGFGKYYDAHRVLPLDTYDWIGTHIITFTEIDGMRRPIMSYKFIEKATCEQYGLPFNGLALFNSASDAHKRSAEVIIESASRRGMSIGYTSSWTVDPDFRVNPGSHELLTELSVASHVLHTKTFRVNESLIGGSVKAKAPLTLQLIGYKRLRDVRTGQELPSFSFPPLAGDPTLALHIDSVPPQAEEWAQKYSNAWEKRLEIGHYRPFPKPVDAKRAA